MHVDIHKSQAGKYKHNETLSKKKLKLPSTSFDIIKLLKKVCMISTVVFEMIPPTPSPWSCTPWFKPRRLHGFQLLGFWNNVPSFTEFHFEWFSTEWAGCEV